MSTARLLQVDAAELATARDAERELAVVWPLLGRHIAVVADRKLTSKTG